MSKEKSGDSNVKHGSAPIPENLPEELLPLYDWWTANGKQALFIVAAAAVFFGGAYAFKQTRAAKISAANQELTRATSLDELEATVANYGSTKAGNAARLRLAKAYYDAGKYEEALDAYETCIRKGAPAGFKEIAELGRAHTCEALNRLDEAKTAYEAFTKTYASHFLQPQAVMGTARIMVLQDNKDGAKKLLENLKAEKTDAPAWEMAIAQLEGIVDRYVPRAERSLFDAASDAASQTAPAPAPVAEPAPAPAPAAE